MNNHLTRRALPLAVTLAALGWSGSAIAASDYLLKLDGVKGEIAAPSSTGQSSGEKHKEWIEILSVQLAEPSPAAGKLAVASGDVSGDGKAPISGQSSGKRTHKPIRVRSQDEETAALLLPAVQKVRTVSIASPAWPGCAAGQKVDAFTIKQKSTGRTGLVLDATVSACAAESVSLNFAKIEWR
jgi:type VI protein secretion system component Hcp